MQYHPVNIIKVQIYWLSFVQLKFNNCYCSRLQLKSRCSPNTEAQLIGAVWLGCPHGRSIYYKKLNWDNAMHLESLWQEFYCHQRASFLHSRSNTTPNSNLWDAKIFGRKITIPAPEAAGNTPSSPSCNLFHNHYLTLDINWTIHCNDWHY